MSMGTDRSAAEKAGKLVQYVARGLALLWAGWWVLFALACGISEGSSFEAIAIHAAPFFAFVIGALIALRWDTAGGIVLLALGLAMFVAAPIIFGSHGVDAVTLMLAAPPILAGALLLVGRRRCASEEAGS
jgi:hypothetical protein